VKKLHRSEKPNHTQSQFFIQFFFSSFLCDPAKVISYFIVEAYQPLVGFWENKRWGIQARNWLKNVPY
jgi:hypothetical protein